VLRQKFAGWVSNLKSATMARRSGFGNAGLAGGDCMPTLKAHGLASGPRRCCKVLAQDEEPSGSTAVKREQNPKFKNWMPDEERHGTSRRKGEGGPATKGLDAPRSKEGRSGRRADEEKKNTCSTKTLSSD